VTATKAPPKAGIDASKKSKAGERPAAKKKGRQPTEAEWEEVEIALAKSSLRERDRRTVLRKFRSGAASRDDVLGVVSEAARMSQARNGTVPE